MSQILHRKRKMKVCLTGNYANDLRPMCEELGFEIVPSYWTSRDDGQAVVVLHHICGCCTPALNLKGEFPDQMDQRDSYLFVTIRAESTERYPWVTRIGNKEKLMEIVRNAVETMTAKA